MNPAPTTTEEPVKRNLIPALMVVAAVLLLAGGATLAATISCTGGLCEGTAQVDTITGSGGDDEILGRRGVDAIDGFAGSDTIRGAGGNDFIVDNRQFRDVDKVFGGKGDDTIDVREFRPDDEPDVVDCGPGTDTIFVDPTDTRLNCEILNPK